MIKNIFTEGSGSTSIRKCETVVSEGKRKIWIIIYRRIGGYVTKLDDPLCLWLQVCKKVLR